MMEPPLMVLPLRVPVTTPLVRVRVLPDGVPDATVKLKEPVIAVFVPEVMVRLPVAVAPETKHGLTLKKKGWLEMLSELSPFTVNEVMKSMAAASPLPPTKVACQMPPAAVVGVAVVLLCPQPETASSSAKSPKIASFFMKCP